jgi:membrane protease YdiL (CAAX protease family)
MEFLEYLLLSLLLLFPVADLVLEKYKFKTKSSEYIKTSLMLWAVTGFLLFCFFQGALTVKPPPILPATDWKTYLSVSIFVACFAYTQYVIFSIKKNENIRLSVLNTLEKNSSLIDILPQSYKEYLLFTLLVSVSAGICEELIFRWFLFSYIELQSDWVIAVICSSFIFGLWHLYLGWEHVIKTALLGVLLCGVYLYFESIVVAIIAHIFMDVYSGTVSYYTRKT